MEEQSKDDQIRDAIMQTLHYGYRNPKGKYIHMTMSVVWQDIREKVPCDREDILRELKYLELHGWIKKIIKKQTSSSYRSKFGTPTLITEYFELSQTGVDLFEHKGKYSKADLGWQTKLPTVRIENTTINGSITIGDNNVVNSYNTTNDVAQIIKMIETRREIADSQKEELKKVIQTELESLLENPNLAQSKSFIEKLKSLGQMWLVPIITQLIAAYLQYHLGIPPSQISPMLHSPFIA